jgi:phytoene dehydrogenase-like protein
VQTQTSETFAADAVVVNFDPRTFLNLIDSPAGGTPFHLPRYKRSGTLCSLFLGVADASILRPRFGNWNLWYHAGPEPVADLYEPGPLDEPRLLYLNSPTLVKGRTNDAPPGHAAVTAFLPCSYGTCTHRGAAATQVWKDKLVSTVIDLIDQRFAPGLREGVDAVHLRTPEDKEQILGAPEGNVYARSFEGREVWAKIPFKGVLPNLYFVGASVSFPGIAQVIHGACRVYRELTGDRV